jgi:hypothetical protein
MIPREPICLDAEEMWTHIAEPKIGPPVYDALG